MVTQVLPQMSRNERPQCVDNGTYLLLWIHRAKYNDRTTDQQWEENMWTGRKLPDKVQQTKTCNSEIAKHLLVTPTHIIQTSSFAVSSSAMTTPLALSAFIFSPQPTATITPRRSLFVLYSAATDANVAAATAVACCYTIQYEMLF